MKALLSPRLLGVTLLGASGVTVAGAETTAADAAIPPASRAAIWLADVPGTAPRLRETITQPVRDAGYAVTTLPTDDLTDPAQVTTNRFELLVLPGARRLPVGAIAPIEAFLKQGGDLLAIGLPAWETPLFRLGGQWRSRAEYEQILSAQPAQRPLLDLARHDPAPWLRHANDPASPARRERVLDAGRPALHVEIDRLTGWDTLEPKPFAPVFAPGQSLTCFKARGGPATRSLALEWIEQDGSRWIATVELGREWRSYALPPEAFHAWEPRGGRGGTGDRLNVANVARFAVGLALSHSALETGRHEYWFADLGTAPNPFGDTAPTSDPAVPRLESVSPVYQCYPIAAECVVWDRAAPRLMDEQALSDRTHTDLDWVDSLPDAALAPAALARAGFRWPAESLRGLHPRPRGVGFRQNRPWRWQPLLGAADAQDGAYRGAIAALLVHTAKPFAGGVWAVFTPDDRQPENPGARGAGVSSPSFYEQPRVRSRLARTLRAMQRGVFLHEAGSEFFTLFPDQAAPLGARVVNYGRRPIDGLRVRVEVRAAGTDRSLFEQEWPLSLGPGASQVFEATWTPDRWPAEQCRVTTRLLEGAVVLDALSHELNRWQPPAEPRFVEAREGRLWLGNQPWKAHGVNYMPSSGIGVASDDFEHWLGRGAYDPETIERDLRRVKALGLNAVSVFIHHRSLDAQHLLDLLFRCERLGLRVNQSLRPGTPMEFRWAEMKALIEHYRLASNDTVFAYDLAWEPSHYNHAHQQRAYAQTWLEWVTRHRGSVEAAEKVWGVPAPRSGSSGSAGPLAVPPMSQLTQDGPWRRLVADYRRFLDELLAAKYSEARRLVRTIDPHHLVSFRMQHAGDPTHNWEGMLPYDLWGLRNAVDLWEPEGYGRIGDWPRVRPGHFTAAYARLCNPALPLIWAEMGYNTWDMARMAPDPAKLETAAQFYADYYRMMRESGADGVFSWWYPGGFRLYENSDFGILNPDGTDRPVSRVIRAEGPAFLAAPKPPPPTQWLSVNRDRDARGLFGIYQAVEAEYWRRVEQGVPVGLRWERPPGE